MVFGKVCPNRLILTLLCLIRRFGRAVTNPSDNHRRRIEVAQEFQVSAESLCTARLCSCGNALRCHVKGNGVYCHILVFFSHFPVKGKKSLAPLEKQGLVHFREKRAYAVDTASDVVATKDTVFVVPDHFRNFTVVVEVVVKRKRDVRPVKPLLAGDVESVAVKDLEQQGQRLKQFLGRHDLRIGRYMVVDDSDVVAPAGESVIMICRPEVNDDLEARIPYAFERLPRMAPASERFTSHTPSKDGMQVSYP